VDTDRTGDDAHDVLGEHAGLVGTDDGGVGHSLAGTEDVNEQSLGGHPLRSECEGKGYGERETFRDGDDDQHDRDNQDVRKGNTILASGTARRRLWERTEAVRGRMLTVRDPGAQSHEETNHQSGEQSQTRNTANLGDELGQVVQLLLLMG